MSDGKKLLLIGGGGHCKSVLDTLYRSKQYTDVAIVDPDCNLNKILESYRIGSDQDLPDLFQKGYHDAFITIGSVGNPFLREKLFFQIENLGFHIPNIIDPSACLSHNIYLEKGIFIGKCAVVNVDVTIGSAAIINTGAIIEHECKIGAFVHVSPGAVLCGNVNVGEYSHIGAGSTVIQGISIGKMVLIGAGSVVTESINDSGIYCGVPARKM